MSFSERFFCAPANQSRQRSNSKWHYNGNRTARAHLLGAARAAAQSGNQAAAHTAYAALIEQWKQADNSLVELREARDYLKQAKR